MTSTLYSHALRILACRGCGAPLDAAVQGGSFPCGYCGAVHQLAARDERREHDPAEGTLSESERCSRLRDQEQRGEGLPASVAALVDVHGRLRTTHLADAKREWLGARAQLDEDASFPLHERFFHLTVLLAPHFAERARRAVLETAAELLEDRRHRHVMRCLLATYAAREGEPAAADEWLSLCDPRSTDLMMDSAYRLARATAAAARGDARGVLAVLGARAGDVPLLESHRLACVLLRIDALERSDHDAEATAMMRALIAANGGEIVREVIREHVLPVGRETWRRIERAECRRRVARLEEERAVLQRPWLDWPKLAVLLLLPPLLALVLGFVWAGGAERLKVDPFFGAHADILCPRTCSGCHGPYHYFGWQSTELRTGRTERRSYRVCEDPAGRVAAQSDWAMGLALHSGEAGWAYPYFVSTDRFYGGTIVGAAPLSVLATGWLLLAGYRWRLRRRRANDAQLELARARLRELEHR